MSFLSLGFLLGGREYSQIGWEWCDWLMQWWDDSTTYHYHALWSVSLPPLPLPLSSPNRTFLPLLALCLHSSVICVFLFVRNFPAFWRRRSSVFWRDTCFGRLDGSRRRHLISCKEGITTLVTDIWSSFKVSKVFIISLFFCFFLWCVWEESS